MAKSPSPARRRRQGHHVRPGRGGLRGSAPDVRELLGARRRQPGSRCQPVLSLTSASVSSKDDRRSSKKRGFPSAPSLTASTTSSGVSSPSRALTKSRSASPARGDSSSLRNRRSGSALRATSKAVTPGSGSGRRVMTSSNGPSWPARKAPASSAARWGPPSEGPLARGR